MYNTFVFTKENLDIYLKELGKRFRKLNGSTMPAEIILIGGAAILSKYGFRESTTDIDACIHASSAMKSAINDVGDKFDLPNNWLNSDFERTSSYTTKLYEVSSYYRTFSNVLQVRVVTAEYLIAMKLRAGRTYKNDLSDILGILGEHQKNGCPITMEEISKAVTQLYESWDNIPDNSKEFIYQIIDEQDLQSAYEQIIQKEEITRNQLHHFEEDYPGVAADSNVEEILNALQKKLQNS